MVEQDQVYGEIARLTSERDHWYQRTMEQAFAKAEAMRDAAALREALTAVLAARDNSELVDAMRAARRAVAGEGTPEGGAK
jgi:hypothetical protein